jgi:GNAT superfamily N-acetyltransferase
VIAKKAAIKDDVRTTGAICFMHGIMTKKPRVEKPLTLVCDDGTEIGSACVGEALGVEIAARFGPRNETPLSIRAYDDRHVLVGGLNGCTHWSWCYIRHFWVEASWRGRGVGRRLMDRAETEAVMRKCVGLYLDTFDPAAEKFYESCGFRRFGRIDGFPPGHTRRFLYKELSPGGSGIM